MGLLNWLRRPRGMLVMACVIIGGLMVWLASLRPDPDHPWIALQDGTSLASIPASALDCRAAVESPFARSCFYPIAGEPLTIKSYHHESGLLECAATYAGVMVECAGGNTVANGPERLAIVQASAIGAGEAELATIREAYPLANWAEATWLQFTSAAALIAALIVLAGLLATRPKRQRQTIALALAVCLPVFVMVQWSLRFYLVLLHLID